MPIARPIGQMAIVASTKCGQLITMAMTGRRSQIADACGQSNRSIIDVIFPSKNGNLFHRGAMNVWIGWDGWISGLGEIQSTLRCY